MISCLRNCATNFIAKSQKFAEEKFSIPFPFLAHQRQQNARPGFVKLCRLIKSVIAFKINKTCFHEEKVLFVESTVLKLFSKSIFAKNTKGNILLYTNFFLCDK